ncbi:glycoside hydrolase family 3 C-terminal domain-containing protein [Nonomuraea sp. NPDC052116]|uniref:glycoside hydrolase family 3 C-terminal domain-containing protein n=1 Tax=Nonomuraea sp. NPDC052116 TaxID=3155665 RepID=UPI0034359712
MTDGRPVVERLTLEEKARLVSGASFWTTAEVPHAGVPAALLTDGPHGVRLQRAGVDHLGLADSMPATAFPTAAALGSSWDDGLLREVGEALAVEARALGVDVLLGPGVNMKRSPLCGRNFEYFAEDPLLAGVMGAAWVAGLQSRGVGASVKHFAANNQETDRMRVSAEVDERTLREIYLRAFEHVVREARPATIMCSYNRVNGVYASENPWLLTTVLREEWGFDGYVVSDWGAVHDPVAAVRSGLDLEMPGTGGRSAAAIVAAVRAGELSEEVLDVAVERLVGTHDRLRRGRAEAEPDFDAHHALARRVAAECAVLLKNDGDLLPLDPESGGPIAVLGEFARTPRYQGAGSSLINPTRLDDALTAIRAATSREVAFAPGFRLDGTPDAVLLAEAVEAARGAAAVLLFLGEPSEAESEGFDREDLDLPEAQLQLLEAVAAVNPSVAVVLSNGGVVLTGPLTEHAAALLEMWLAGQAGGGAAADLIFGHADPSGRLAETVPHRLSDTPAHVNWPGSEGQVLYGERLYIGYRWYDRTGRDVAFPFGFGLSYTTFAYSDLAVHVPDPARPEARVEVTVTNTGTREGAEVVQVYVSDPVADVDRPERELRGFRKVRLAPGESARVVIELDARAFSYWSTRHGQWVAEPGEYGVHVGSSSRDLPLEQRIHLDVESPRAALRADSTLQEWLAHPQGRKIVEETLLKAADGEQSFFTDPASQALIAQIPLATLLSMGASQGGQQPPAMDDLLRMANSEAPAS